MISNVGGFDRRIRILVGLFLLIFSFFTPYGWIAGMVGIFIFLSGMIGFCPAYAILKIDTILVSLTSDFLIYPWE